MTQPGSLRPLVTVFNFFTVIAVPPFDTSIPSGQEREHTLSLHTRLSLILVSSEQLLRPNGSPFTSETRHFSLI